MSEITYKYTKYDDLGRLETNTKGNSESLTATYNYNIRSWTDKISSPLLKIHLAYTAGGNIKNQLWNQNINKQGAKDRSYAFEYDGLSRLKSAAYTSEVNGEAYGTSYEYDKHGNIMSLIRNGKTTKNYDLVDDLKMTYVGNQLTKVRDEVKGVSLSESADFQNFAGDNGLMTYNRNGALASDSHKGITSIQYNFLNLPTSITVGGVGVPVNGNIQYTYSASGIKLQTIHTENNDLQRVPMMGISTFGIADATVTKTDYVGNKVYENDKLKRILIDGGYYDAQKKKYFYYLTDHLGNNRVVAEANGTIVQQTQYYPFGMAFADHEGEEEQPYKYNNKELDKRLRLNRYDYSARGMNSAIGRFDGFDPLAERYFNISPYVYCANNPLRFVDPTGMAYRPTKDEDGNYNGFEWVDEEESYNEDGSLKDGLFDKAIFFKSLGTWKQGKYQKDANGNFRYVSNNVGSATATVYDYQIGEDGVMSPTETEYQASVSPSDPSTFGTVAQGLYQAVRHKHQGRYWALGMRTLAGSAAVPAQGGVNPSNGGRTVSGANIHHAGLNNATSTFWKGALVNVPISYIGSSFGDYSLNIESVAYKTNYRYSGVSEGCFLIDVNQWNNFMNHFPVGVGKIGILNK